MLELPLPHARPVNPHATECSSILVIRACTINARAKVGGGVIPGFCGYLCIIEGRLRDQKR